MNLIKRHETRLSQTPNAAMTTLASPTLGGAALSMWRVKMTAGSVGPLHAFDVDQIWTVEDGAATVRASGVEYLVEAGDTLVMPAGQLREIHADTGADFTALVAAPAGARASLADGTDRGVPPWIS